jgi:hypothetical protein|eukprot:TRINITY_DN67146_c0_g1_i1.p1 TRINITY_DN67146_c0_g1~~TRINITY_DN67146_c0_g1_i1.p1  ORF type:complete len:326 (-),score=62.61 TRINITY_DN67146_c0_g1_i1:203-1180(-)
MSSHKYLQDDAGNADSDNTMELCAQAGRKCVRNISMYPILSPEWVALIDSLDQLVKLVRLEGRMPANAKVSEAQGRNTESEGTLWDQERNETAIRILVEEAKVNLCLRIMNEFKKWGYDSAVREAAIEKAVSSGIVAASDVEKKLQQFEESLGVLLVRAFSHAETLQLMDIPLLIEHCELVLSRRTAFSAASSKTQDTLVLYYFSSLMKHAEVLNTSELLANTRQLRLVPLVVSAALQNAEEYPMEVKAALAEGFAAMADNEDFSTQWEDFFVGDDGDKPSQDSVARFLELDEKIVAPLLKENPGSKRAIRPLLDFFATLQRKFK